MKRSVSVGEEPFQASEGAPIHGHIVVDAVQQEVERERVRVVREEVVNVEEEAVTEERFRVVGGVLQLRVTVAQRSAQVQVRSLVMGAKTRNSHTGWVLMTKTRYSALR